MLDTSKKFYKYVLQPFLFNFNSKISLKLLYMFFKKIFGEPLNMTLIKPMQKYPNINESEASIL